MFRSLKKIPGIKFLEKNIFFRFLIRTVRSRVNLNSIDKKSPFLGRMHKFGFDQFTLSKEAIEELNGLWENGQKKLKFSDSQQLVLSEKESYAIKEIFDYVTREVRLYLGDAAYLDGINWMITSPDKSSSSISKSWHTDGCGSRLKVFVCVKGDGSTPTIIMPSQSRLVSTRKWLTFVLLEAPRWLWIGNTYKLNNQKSLHHSTGTGFIFDTNLFHRGGYESAKSERIIFHLEFSVPEKHKIANGPIGTFNHYNSFEFDISLLTIDSFRGVLDPKRVHEVGMLMKYSNEI
jgi:hypothetical protein